MTLEEAYGYSSPNQCLARLSWIDENNKIYHLISCVKTLEEIKKELIDLPESLTAEDWNVFEVRDY